MAPVRLIAKPAPAAAALGLPVDVMMAWLLMALAWAFTGYLGWRLLDPRSDLETTLQVLAMITAYEVCALAIAARARKLRR
jgi:hypothetical protein